MSRTLQPYEPLVEIDKNLYCVDGDWYETTFRRRMTVIRLSDQSLVIHSAIQMTDKDLMELDKLGTVGTIIIPNVFHDSDAQFYAERYPAAKVYVPSKILAKCTKKMQVAGTLEQNWPHERELACIPFRNTLVNESVFIHTISRTLLVTDLAFNLTAEDFKSPIERKILGQWNGLLEGFGPSHLTKFLAARNRDSVREALKKISAYDFNRVIMSHGKIVESNGKQLFLTGYQRVYGPDII